MDRNSTTEFQTEIVKSQNMPVHLVAVYFDDETMYMNDSYKTINFDGNDYLGVGHFMGFSDIEETSKIIVSSMTLSLSGIDQEWIANVLAKDYINREVKVWTGFLNDLGELIDSPVLFFQGNMDAPTISENPDASTSIVSVTATNIWADFNRKTGRHSNNEEQQILYPGDKGFEFAAQNVDSLVWRKHQDTTES